MKGDSAPLCFLFVFLFWKRYEYSISTAFYTGMGVLDLLKLRVWTFGLNWAIPSLILRCSVVYFLPLTSEGYGCARFGRIDDDDDEP